MVLRLMKELSPSVPHCRDVTEQPITPAKAIKTSVILIFCMGAFPCGRCVFDPNIQVFCIFVGFFVFEGRSQGPLRLPLVAPFFRYAQLFPFGVDLY